MKYYKALTEIMTSPIYYNTKWSLDCINKLGNRRPLKMCNNGLHLYTSLDMLTSAGFGSRVFEAEPIGEILEDDSDDTVVCCRKVKLVRELDPSEVTDSVWAFWYCQDIQDIPSVYENITESEWAYEYCDLIKDRPSVRKNITDSDIAFEYCKNIKDRPSVRKHITDSGWACDYCELIKDRAEVRKHITDSYWAYKYCRYIKDRPSVRKHITDPEWMNLLYRKDT